MKTALGICFRNLLQVRFLLLAAVFLFAVDGWAGCNETSYIPSSLTSSFCTGVCVGSCNSPSCSSYPLCRELGQSLIGVEFFINGRYCVVKNASENQNCWTSQSCANCGSLFTSMCCDTKCERDSIVCYKSGKLWDSDNCECVDLCASSEEKCTSAGGTFTGRVLSTGPNSACCSAVCDLCNGVANENIVNLKTKYCCDAGFAPPPESQNCYNPPGISGCGMTVLQRMTSDLDYKCRDPNSSPDASADFFNKCYGSSSSGVNSSSSGIGSSDSGNSSGGGGSSGYDPPYPEECYECPWLDSILDTLTAQKGIVESIYSCVVMPSLCNSGTESVSDPFQFDTAWYNYIRPYLDTSLRLDSQQLEALKRLDTNQLKLLESNIEQLRNDTLFRLAVSGGFSQTQDAISQTRGSIVHLNDTTRKWLDRISSKIGFTTDSLIVHIDSIRKDIPVQVLDSILKYQKQLAEKEDSLVLGDLPSIDSLIDSTVRYWRMSMEKDSLRRLESNDSLFALHDAIDAVALRMSYLLGYGDTASSDLRKDLFSMNDTVKAHFDSIAARLGISTDSLIAHIDGLNNSSIDSLRVDLNSFSESFRTYRDSVITYFGAFLSAESSYHVTFKDSMGSINGTLGQLLAKFSPGAIDTNGLGVWASYVRSGENMGDSIVRSYGWQNLKNLNVDSNYSAALAGYPNKTDSVSAVVDDSLSNRAARLNDSLVRKNDSLKRSLPDTLTKYADSLIIWAPFADFDSIIYSTIGTRIPNRDDCPEDCQSWSVSIPVIGLVNYTVDYGLCLGRASLGNLSVLAFLKLLIRIIVAITCVMIIYRTLVAIK